MKSIYLFILLFTAVNTYVSNTANAQALGPKCDPSKRCTVPQLARVCSVTPPFTPAYKEIINKKTNKRKIITSGIPNHNIGIFPIADDSCGSGRPTALAEHDTSYSIPATVGTRTTKVKWLSIGEKLGVALNGVMLDPLADEYWNGDKKWRMNALLNPDMATDLDCNMAHIQADGAYHYHALPTGLYELLGGRYPWTDNPPPLKSQTGQLGWAFDGTPIYGPLCSRVDSVAFNWWKPRSGWVLRTGTRSSGPGGAYNGDYDSDFVYKKTAVDLDSVNGHFAPTPENPHGIYHYHITEEFPYMPRGFLLALPIPVSPLHSEFSINNKQGNHFKVYPSPAKDRLHIQLTGNATFTLSNAAGKRVLTKTINSDGNMNIAGLLEGLYYLKNHTTGEVQEVLIAK